MTATLKPCPFCGAAAARLESKSGDWGYTPASACVVCDSCGVSTPRISLREEYGKRGWTNVNNPEEESAAAWNQRTP